jgi:uncharacterized protein YecT (DUF1311 family)
MPQVNLTNVTGQELRQLLDSSRRRGDAALSYRILQEMAARREAPAERRAFKGRRPAEPRLVAVEFGDPLDKTEDLPPMPNWRPPGPQTASETASETEIETSAPPESALAAATPQPRRSRRAPQPDRALAMAAAASASFAAEDDAPPPSPSLDADRPLSLREFDPEPIEDEADDPPPPSSGFQPIELGVPKQPPRSRGRLLFGAVLGVILGIAVGWLGGWLARDGMSRPSGPAAPVQTAALAPVPAPAPAAVAVEPAPDVSATTALGPGDAQPAPQDSAPPASPPKAQDTAPVPDGTAMELPAPGTEEAEAEAAKAAKAERAAKTAERARAARERAALAQAAPEAPAVAKGCGIQPTPADRTICGDARLRRLQADLRRAYDEALAAHEDRALLREHQLAWRDTRSAVADPERLARLYEERIRKLNAATAEARRARQ